MSSNKQETDDQNINTNRVFAQGPVIVGAGPSGLAVAACLKEHGIPSIILERSDCIGSLWQKRAYDRLKLHIPKQFCELPLLSFPKHFPKYPTKHQFVSYLESYAEHFSIDPKFGQHVSSAEFDPLTGFWQVRTREARYFSKWLIVASGENTEPVIPEINGLESFRGSLMHTSAYKSGSEFEKQRVLVVGCGNSGMEVSLDLCRHNARPHLVVRDSVHVLPRDMFGISTFSMAMNLLNWLPLRLVDKFLLLVANLTLGDTDKLGLGRPKTGPIELKYAIGKTPVLDVGAISLVRSGKIKIMEGVKEITRTGAKFIDGQEKEFDSIILATGYKSNVPSWLKDSEYLFKALTNGWKGEKGLYVVGFTRRGLLGISSDAVHIASDIASSKIK